MIAASATQIAENATHRSATTVMHRADLLRELELLHPDGMSWAMACCNRDREEAEEVLHMAYEAVLDGRARHDGRASMRTWLFGVIRLTALAHRRRRLLRWFRWERPLGDGDAADAGADAAAALTRDESTRALATALKQLPSRQREVLHLVFYQELSIREASGIMGISLGSARTHYERGKARLRALLDGTDR